MAILWISNETPDRWGQGGQRRQFFQIESLLADGIDVAVMTLAGEQDDTEVRKLAPVHRFRPPSRRGVPDVPARIAARRFLRSRGWDGVVVAHSESWPAGSRVARRLGLPVLLDMHNVQSQWFRARGELDVARWYDDLELQILTAADTVAVCADRELEYLPDRFRDKVVVMGHGIDPGEWSLAPAPPTARVVKLFGNWRWEPNRLGLEWFVAEVWPLLRAADPTIRCEVGGATDMAASPAAGISLLGRVPTVPEFVHDATVLGVPVINGVGAPLKYAEALVSGVPVAATRDAAHGFPIRAGLVSDDPLAWADFVHSCTTEPELLRSRALETRQRVLTDWTWHAQSAPLRNWAAGLSGSPSSR